MCGYLLTLFYKKQDHRTQTYSLGRTLANFPTSFLTSFSDIFSDMIRKLYLAKIDVNFLHEPVHILRLCIALFCYSLFKNDISKLTDARFSNDVKKDVGKHVGKHVGKDSGLMTS